METYRHQPTAFSTACTQNKSGLGKAVTPSKPLKPSCSRLRLVYRRMQWVILPLEMGMAKTARGPVPSTVHHGMSGDIHRRFSRANQATLKR